MQAERIISRDTTAQRRERFAGRNPRIAQRGDVAVSRASQHVAPCESVQPHALPHALSFPSHTSASSMLLFCYCGKFGSRDDVLLPPGADVIVKLHETVQGGVTVLAKLR